MNSSGRKCAAFEFCLAHEHDLWKAFRAGMLESETGDWLWQTPVAKDQPQDVRYAVGARIVEFYYNNAPDKKKAAFEIISMTDYPAFLEKSKYEAYMAGRRQPK
jgi:hypothetical protein